VNTAWIRIVHVAREKTGIDDDAYRGILSGVGLSSSKEIETAEQFNTVMKAFENLGFRYDPKAGSSPGGKRRATVAGNPDFITKRQEYYIKGLQQLAMRAKDEDALRKIIKRIGKVDDIQFLLKRNASAVILALRDICRRAGINPDCNNERSGLCS